MARKVKLRVDSDSECPSAAMIEAALAELHHDERATCAPAIPAAAPSYGPDSRCAALGLGWHLRVFAPTDEGIAFELVSVEDGARLDRVIPPTQCATATRAVALIVHRVLLGWSRGEAPPDVQRVEPTEPPRPVPPQARAETVRRAPDAVDSGPARPGAVWQLRLDVGVGLHVQVDPAAPLGTASLGAELLYDALIARLVLRGNTPRSTQANMERLEEVQTSVDLELGGEARSGPWALGISAGGGASLMFVRPTSLSGVGWAVRPLPRFSATVAGRWAFDPSWALRMSLGGWVAPLTERYVVTPIGAIGASPRGGGWLEISLSARLL